MKSYVFAFAGCLIFLVSCKNKKKDPEEAFVSSASIIRGQVNHIDTSLYQITKYSTTEDQTDTVFLKREELREEAQSFLELPDITVKDLQKKYTQEQIIDAGQNTLSITSVANDSTLEIQKQIIIVGLEDGNSGEVRSIFIDRIRNYPDSSIEQKLYWEVDKFFRIANIIQKENSPEKTSLIKVTWE